MSALEVAGTGHLVRRSIPLGVDAKDPSFDQVDDKERRQGKCDSGPIDGFEHHRVKELLAQVWIM